MDTIANDNNISLEMKEAIMNSEKGIMTDMLQNRNFANVEMKGTAMKK